MMLIYGPTILVDAGVGTASQAIFSTIIAFWLVKKFGRREIMITGVTVMAMGHVAMSATFFMDGSPFLNFGAVDPEKGMWRYGADKAKLPNP